MAAMKSFKNNPALQFISVPQESALEAGEQSADSSVQPVSNPETVSSVPDMRSKRNKEYGEVKSKRVQLVLQPSLYDRTKKAADRRGVSLNEYIHIVLRETLRGEDG